MDFVTFEHTQFGMLLKASKTFTSLIIAGIHYTISQNVVDSIMLLLLRTNRLYFI